MERLKEYYFKQDAYSSMTANLPIRVLVGHKGTGKSALFKVSISEDKGKGNLPILIHPDDVAGLGEKGDNFLQRVSQWKEGLMKIIIEKVYAEFDVFDVGSDRLNSAIRVGKRIWDLLHGSLSAISDNVCMDAAKKEAFARFRENRRITVYIDDLDRGWEGKKDDIARISALLSAIRDLSNTNEGIHFKLSLRSDVYYLVRTSDESTDKIEGSVVWLKWTRHDIFVVLLKRILTYFGESFSEENLIRTPQRYLKGYLDRVMAPRFCGKGKWKDVEIHKVLLSMIRNRPRDLVKLCSLAAHRAHSDRSSVIKSEHFQQIFEEYSQGRLQDTINEYRTELPDIDALVLGMKPSNSRKADAPYFLYTDIQLKRKLKNIMEQHPLRFSNGKAATVEELINFLYKINFISARKTLADGKIQRIDFEDNRYVASRYVNYGYEWEVHPAFRWALQPDRIEDVFDSL